MIEIIETQTLREIEETLLALTEVDPQELTQELKAQLEIELKEAIRVAPQKRERVAMKLFDKGQRVAILRAKSQYLKDRAKEVDAIADREEADIERLKDYVLDVMRELPEPKKGKTRILEGTSAIFKAAKVAASVEIYDEAALPERFTTATVTMPAHLWRSMTRWEAEYPEELAALPVSWGRVEKKIIKAELEQPCEMCNLGLMSRRCRKRGWSKINCGWWWNDHARSVAHWADQLRGRIFRGDGRAGRVDHQKRRCGG